MNRLERLGLELAMAVRRRAMHDQEWRTAQARIEAITAELCDTPDDVLYRQTGEHRTVGDERPTEVITLPGGPWLPQHTS